MSAIEGKTHANPKATAPVHAQGARGLGKAPVTTGKPTVIVSLMVFRELKKKNAAFFLSPLYIYMRVHMTRCRCPTLFSCCLTAPHPRAPDDF